MERNLKMISHTVVTSDCEIFPKKTHPLNFFLSEMTALGRRVSVFFILRLLFHNDEWFVTLDEGPHVSGEYKMQSIHRETQE